MRKSKNYDTARVLSFKPERKICPLCQSPLVYAYETKRYVIKLEGVYLLFSEFSKCSNPDCSKNKPAYAPEAESRLVLPHYSFGLDIIALIGELRYSEHKSISEIDKILVEEYQVSISEREVEYLEDVYLALVTCVAKNDKKLLARIKENGGIVLSIDGVQPEKGHETLYILRDCLTGNVLTAKNLQSSDTDSIKALIKEVIELRVPIIGVISDGQVPIRLAVSELLPGTPHQLCHYHYLNYIAKPIVETDRNMKKEIKKKLKGLRKIEKEVSTALPEKFPDEDRKIDTFNQSKSNICEEKGSSLEAKPVSHTSEEEVIADYCLAIRTAMQLDGCYPLKPPGLKLYETLGQIATSLKSSISRRSSSLLVKLLTIVSIISSFKEQYLKVYTLYTFIWKIAKTLDLENKESGSKVKKRLLGFIGYLKRIRKESSNLKPYIESIIKITESFTEGLFYCFDNPIIPNTNNSLESFIGAIKKHARKITGRKSSHKNIIRYGPYLAFVEQVLPLNLVEEAAIISQEDFKEQIKQIKNIDKHYSKTHRIKHHLSDFLGELEKKWVLSHK
jgi:hypothetical protein